MDQGRAQIAFCDFSVNLWEIMDTFPLNVQPAVTPAAASCDEKLMFAFFFFWDYLIIVLFTRDLWNFEWLFYK